jgi:spermidine/putrescine transport system ATP-binding protein
MAASEEAVRSSGMEQVAKKTIVRLEGVTVRFGKVVALSDANIDIYAGEFFSLLGPSGCGKTTTLKVIGGFQQPTSGLVYLEGDLVTNVPPNKRNVNTVFQNYALFPHMNIYDNIAFGLKMKKVPHDQIRQRVKESLELIELPDITTRKPNELSGGQQQLVALARALINRPSVLLLDEPLGALDLQVRKRLQVELKKIQQKVGITFVYVTRDQEEALLMSDRIAVMQSGLVQQIGTAKEIYQNPANRFVAGFIGASNILSGEIMACDGRSCELKIADGWVARSQSQQIIPRGTNACIMVRPECVMLSSQASPDATNSFRGTVRNRYYLGSVFQVIVELFPGQMVTVAHSQREGSVDAEELEIGQEVYVSWSPENSTILTEG